MEIVLAREEVRCGQAHEREPRAIGPAANRLLLWLETRAAERRPRTLDDLRPLVQHLAHVAVLLLNRDLNGRSHFGRDRPGDLLDEGFLLGQLRRVEIANDQADAR